MTPSQEELKLKLDVEKAMSRARMLMEHEGFFVSRYPSEYYTGFQDIGYQLQYSCNKSDTHVQLRVETIVCPDTGNLITETTVYNYEGYTPLQNYLQNYNKK